MPQRATSVSQSVLKWARERAGLSPVEVASRLQKAPETVLAWEAGEAFPAYGQLETLAQVYRRPVALFFLPEPPFEEPVEHEFRTLPDADIASLSADTRFALRDAWAYLSSLRELAGGWNPSERLITQDIHASADEDVVHLAQTVRGYLGVPIETQQRWRDAEHAMAGWRLALEDAGIFVFKRSFRQREVSGFCIHDDQFPLVVVNNTTPFTRQIFTLFHELAHLLIGVSSITKDDSGFLARLAPADRSVEITCNRFAGEFLVPEASFPFASFSTTSLDDFLQEQASTYHVSREVILRRLLDRGLVNSDVYASLVSTWSNEPARAGGGEGGSYYATQAAYLSGAFLNLAFSRMREGHLSLQEAAEHLRMKAKNVVKLEDYLFARG